MSKLAELDYEHQEWQDLKRSVMAGSKHVCTYAERLEFLRSSSLGRLLGYDDEPNIKASR